MSGKLYIASILAFTLIGCGGSNAGSCCGGGFVATGNGEILADQNGNIIGDSTIKIKKNGTDDGTSNLTITNLGEGSDCATNPCTVTGVQTTSCPDDKDTPKFVALSACEKAAVEAKIGSVEDNEVIAYGGTITLSEANGNITSCSLDLTLGLPSGSQGYCGQALDGCIVGFGGHYGDNKVYALITVTGACGATQIWAEGTITGNSSTGYSVSFPGLTNVVLPATISLFRVAAKPTWCSTGSTGLTGSGGYGG